MYTENILKETALHFDIDNGIKEVKALGPGFINDTFIVSTGTSDSVKRYILQRKNHLVFPDIAGMMSNILQITEHIRKKVIEKGGNPDKEVLTVIKTKDGGSFYKDGQGNYWAMCLYIEGSRTYEKADTPALAYKGGEGIGKFQTLLSDFTSPLNETIKGFHNIRWRLTQWEEAMKSNAAGRIMSLGKEIEWIESRKDTMMSFWGLVENGTLPLRVTHNDTKISNILFDEKGDVMCVIDLDTCMSSTSLNDFGDAIRSYANTGAEDDRNPENVSMSMEMFAAYAEGYLSQRKCTLCASEIDNLAFSALYITYEQVLRFLMDYINGDTYYKIAYPEHNLVRTHAQFRLLTSMESQYDAMTKTVADIMARQ